MIDEKNGLINGVVTNQGAIMCDEIIVACGYGTKTVLDKLSIKFPLMPV